MTTCLKITIIKTSHNRHQPAGVQLEVPHLGKTDVVGGTIEAINVRSGLAGMITGAVRVVPGPIPATAVIVEGKNLLRIGRHAGSRRSHDNRLFCIDNTFKILI